MNSLKCKNLKVSFTLNSDIDLSLAKQKCFISENRTSFIIRHQVLSCVFTIYRHSLSCLHCTGINQACMISDIIEFIRIELENQVISTSIDNSLFTCKQNCLISLNDIIQKIQNTEDPIYFCQYINEIFPALFLKSKFKKSGIPSIIIFHNSSYVIIGGKCVKRVKEADAFVKILFSKI